MLGEEIKQLFNRLARLVEATQQKSGDGTEWDVTFQNGETHSYVIRNIKSHDEVEDQVFNLLIWIWNAKDYLKFSLETKGGDPNYIERIINDDPALSLCADLANWLKHGRLKKSRTYKFPKLGKVRMIVPQSAIRSIVVRAFEVDIDISNPDDVECQMPIFDEAGNKIGEAFECAAAAIRRLEKIREDIEQMT